MSASYFYAAKSCRSDTAKGDNRHICPSAQGRKPEDSESPGAGVTSGFKQGRHQHTIKAQFFSQTQAVLAVYSPRDDPMYGHKPSYLKTSEAVFREMHAICATIPRQSGVARNQTAYAAFFADLHHGTGGFWAIGARVVAKYQDAVFRHPRGQFKRVVASFFICHGDDGNPVPGNWKIEPEPDV
jgi:hypothetical protein